MGFTQELFTLLSGESLTSGQTAQNGTDFNSKELDIGAFERIAVTVRATSDSASTADVDFKLASSVDGANWDTHEGGNLFKTATLTLSGTTTQQATYVVDVGGLTAIRVEQIDNKATAALSDVAVDIGYEY